MKIARRVIGEIEGWIIVFILLFHHILCKLVRKKSIIDEIEEKQ